MNTDMMRDPYKLWSLMMAPDKEVTWIETIPGIPDAVVVRFKSKASSAMQLRYVNPAIGAFTTAYARSVLYRKGFMSLTPDQMLYADTDSVVYIRDIADPTHGKIDTTRGHLLGEFKDEFDGHDYIKRFYAIAPKTYAYCTNKGKVEVKSKGFTLNHTAIKTVNVDAFKAMVSTNGTTISVTYKNRIERDRIAQLPYVVEQTKTMHTFYNKRRIMSRTDESQPIRTVPWGYRS